MKLDTLTPQERHCALLIDEMQISTSVDFDPTVQKVVELAMAPLAKNTDAAPGMATHGLVVMLTGLSSHWKQVIAYHFTGELLLF